MLHLLEGIGVAFAGSVIAVVIMMLRAPVLDEGVVSLDASRQNRADRT